GFGFRHYFSTRYRTLPEMLHEYGYYNVFFQGSGNLLADNTKSFLDHNHFDAVKSAKHFIGKKDKKDVFGWGVQDKLLYRSFFEFYDTQIKHQNKPFFAVLPTIFTHNNTVQIPQKDRYFYKDAASSFEYFSNVVHLTDRQLKVLMEGLDKRGLLENTIVIITGDHSRSAISDSKVSFNQTGFNDDIFQVPFLLLWKGHVEPKRVSTVAFSQVDIAPTLVDVLGLEVGKHHFQGVSMFRDVDENNVFLVQPYDGIFLASINLPYKFGTHLRSGKRYLYNVLDDPYETNNIVDKYPEIAASMEASIDLVYQTNALIEHNKVWQE
ncbi:sulfatase-like hydrolase/transferase, partial [bacterium]|nr:sulfatase-like hydrolase/transferase [bacterium]